MCHKGSKNNGFEMEHTGLEPVASTLPVWRAPNCANAPYGKYNTKTSGRKEYFLTDHNYFTRRSLRRYAPCCGRIINDQCLPAERAVERLAV